MINKLKLGQFFTPEWAALELVDRYFPDLNLRDLVVEPSCGLGAFLKAIPSYVPAFGVEIDPELAVRCRENSGREVLTGDFVKVGLPAGITALVGNPPFRVKVIDSFIRRAWEVLPEGGRCGMIIPAYAMQTHSTVMGWNRRWSIQADVIPRRLFPRLRLPLLFVMFTREEQRKIIGFALYREACDIDWLAKDARKVVEDGRPRQGAWHALVDITLEKLGGEADLQEIYKEIEPKRPTSNAWWREKVRQVLQLHFEPVARGRWRKAGTGERENVDCALESVGATDLSGAGNYGEAGNSQGAAALS